MDAPPEAPAPKGESERGTLPKGDVVEEVEVPNGEGDEVAWPNGDDAFAEAPKGDVAEEFPLADCPNGD